MRHHPERVAKKGWVGNYYLDKDGVMVTYAYVKNGAKYYWINSGRGLYADICREGYCRICDL